MGMVPVELFLELGFQGGHLWLLPASGAVEADATPDCRCVEPFTWRGKACDKHIQTYIHKHNLFDMHKQSKASG